MARASPGPRDVVVVGYDNVRLTSHFLNTYSKSDTCNKTETSKTHMKTLGGQLVMLYTFDFGAGKPAL